VTHPAWCDEHHNPDWPVHTADVGAEDIAVTPEVDVSVQVFQSGDEPAQVWLCEHSRMNTAVTALTAEQAAELGQRLLDAARSVGWARWSGACKIWSCGRPRAPPGAGSRLPMPALAGRCSASHPTRVADWAGY
jgi:hypothetical protein